MSKAAGSVRARNAETKRARRDAEEVLDQEYCRTCPARGECEAFDALDSTRVDVAEHVAETDLF